jgi:hypothetical protein
VSKSIIALPYIIQAASTEARWAKYVIFSPPKNRSSLSAIDRRAKENGENKRERLVGLFSRAAVQLTSSATIRQLSRPGTAVAVDRGSRKFAEAAIGQKRCRWIGPKGLPKNRLCGSNQERIAGEEHTNLH